MIVLLLACAPSPFTDREWERLAHLVMDDVEPPTNNPWADDEDARALGEVLFHDPGLSGPLTTEGAEANPDGVSCATCHDLGSGGADSRGTPTSLGADHGLRNTPSLLNVAYRRRWSWGGEFEEMWRQNLSPIELTTAAMNSNEIDLVCTVVERYADRFEDVFGVRPELPEVGCWPTERVDGNDLYELLTDPGPVDAVREQVGQALEAFLRPIRSCNSPFDRMMCDQDPDVLGEDAIRGAKLFVGRAECVQCHFGGTLADVSKGGFHVIGVPTDDLGRYGNHPDVGKKQDRFRGQFQTPTLRNVSLTGPYMHDGSVETLEGVVDHYRYGGEADGYPGTLDPLIRPLALSNEDVNDLVAFLVALTDEGEHGCDLRCGGVP